LLCTTALLLLHAASLISRDNERKEVGNATRLDKWIVITD
jgi:hypothetical protein